MNKTLPNTNGSARRAKRTYRAPAIEETGSFERLVLSCGHTPEDEQFGTNPNCTLTPVNTTNS